MNDKVRENLVGLLLGALDDDERQELESQLELDVELRAELERLRDCLQPLDESTVVYERPRGLADRTFAHVQREAAVRETFETTGMRPVAELASGGSSWNWYDMVVACVVVIGFFTLLSPGMLASRESSNRTFCQHNLTQVGFGLHEFATQSPDQRLPQIPLRGNRSFAGVYAPMLLDHGYIDKPTVFFCPSSDQAIRTMPTLADLDLAEPSALPRIQRLAGGSYGYNLGYVFNRSYRAPTIRIATPLFVWAADAPSWNASGRLSENHSGQGHNVLFADMHVAFETNVLRPNGDDVYRNDNGLVQAGLDRQDSVVGGSLDRPFPRVTPPDFY